MKNRYMRERFISGLLVILSVTSLALFGLQLWTSALGSPPSVVDDVKIDSRLLGGGFYWWTTLVQAFLLLTLVLMALGSLVSLRLTRRSEAIRRYLSPRDTSSLPAKAQVAS